MARQSTMPVTFDRTTRTDFNSGATSGKAGEVLPVDYIPLLRGDACSGTVQVAIELGEMPRPTLNAVVANVQAWFVPKTAFPKFSGHDEFMHSYQGQPIKAPGVADREPPKFFDVYMGANATAIATSPIFKTLGLHVPTGKTINADIVDSFNLIYNFRLASFSSRLERRKYSSEDLPASLTLPPAFWPPYRMIRAVPDYERALIVGAFGLDVIAGAISYEGTLPVSVKQGAIDRASQRLRKSSDGALISSGGSSGSDKGTVTGQYAGNATAPNVPGGLYVPVNGTATANVPGYLDPGTSLECLADTLVGRFQGDSITVSLADIDKARETQAWAKLRSSYAGNDTTGFNNDEVLVAELMSGFRPPEEAFRRPWLLDSKLVPFNMPERHATDGASLDQSVTQGRLVTQLSCNVPHQEAGGVIIITVEVVPERVDERQADEFVLVTEVNDLPNALRDVQRSEPVDQVLNRRFDAKHTSPDGIYGFEPMNDKWNRQTTRLGGSFYQATPGAPWTEQRSALWLASIVDPQFTADHFLVPSPFPQNVFSFEDTDNVEIRVKHSFAITGNTQIGDVLVENNDDYEAVQEAGQ